MALYNNIVSFKDANGVDNTVTLYRIGDTDDYYHFEIENPGGSPRISRDDRKRLADALYRTLDLEPVAEDKGLKFNEVFQQDEYRPVTDASELTTGVKVRVTSVSSHIGDYEVGDEGTIVDPGIPAFNGRVWVHVPDKIEEGHGWAMKPEHLEILKPAETAAETAAETVENPNLPTTYGQVIEAALTRFNGAADIVTDGMFISEQDRELATALRVLVAGLVISPRGEKALRKIVGE